MLPVNTAYNKYVANFEARALTPLSFDAWRERHWGEDNYKRNQWADLENFWEIHEMFLSLLRPPADRKVF